MSTAARKPSRASASTWSFMSEMSGEITSTVPARMRGRDLERERLARAGRHDADAVAAGEHRIDELALAGAELAVPEDASPAPAAGRTSWRQHPAEPSARARLLLRGSGTGENPAPVPATAHGRHSSRRRWGIVARVACIDPSHPRGIPGSRRSWSLDECQLAIAREQRQRGTQAAAWIESLACFCFCGRPRPSRRTTTRFDRSRSKAIAPCPPAISRIR